MRSVAPQRIGHRAATAGLLAALVFAAAPVFVPDAQARRGHDQDWRDAHSAEALEWSWRLSPGKTIEIKGMNGKIVAEGTDGDKVEVSATKRWRRSDPEKVRIEVIEHEGGVTLCTVYPNRWGKPPNDCQVGEKGHSSVDNNDVVVEYVVKVPAGVRFVGRTVNGGIEATDLEGPAEAYTVNGSVRVDTRDEARAETVNGSIVASVGSASWRGSLEFSTVNGSITLALPDKVAAQVHAETVNGDISTDFPLTVSGRFSRRSINGTIGRSEHAGDLALSTVNGSIRLRSAQ